MKNNIYGMDYNAPKLIDIIDRFIEGNATTAEYVYPKADYVNHKSAASSLRAAVKRERARITVSTKAGKVYMTKA